MKIIIKKMFGGTNEEQKSKSFNVWNARKFIVW